jgi:hypothetical protein
MPSRRWRAQAKKTAKVVKRLSGRRPPAIKILRLPRQIAVPCVEKLKGIADGHSPAKPGRARAHGVVPRRPDQRRAASAAAPSKPAGPTDWLPDARRRRLVHPASHLPALVAVAAASGYKGCPPR